MAIDEEWVQLAPDIAFQSKVDNKNNDQQMNRAKTLAIERMLWGNKNQNNSGPQSTSPYVVGYEDMNQDWDSEQLAWHLLGFYIDCNSEEDDRNEQKNNKEEDHHHRRLSYGNTVCKRKMLYAVYVDPNHQGGGLGEYKYYNKQTGAYDCYNGGSCRAQMDCHSSTTTTWQLIGIFKIERVTEEDSWMEQLFKHAGVCYWGKENFEVASDMREALPTECQKTSYVANGNYLYVDVKPTTNAGLSLGLYTDSLCSQPYVKGIGRNFDPFSVIDKTQSDFNTFNTLLNDYKICQPCIAYDLGEDDFTCKDEAGYTNCNQCTKFIAKAEGSIATPKDIKLAYMQQTMLPLGNLNGAATTTSLRRVYAAHFDPFSQLLHVDLSSYVKVSIAFFFGCLIFALLPKRLSKRMIAPFLQKREGEYSDNQNMLKSPLSASTAEISDLDDQVMEQVIEHWEDLRSGVSAYVEPTKEMAYVLGEQLVDKVSESFSWAVDETEKKMMENMKSALKWSANENETKELEKAYSAYKNRSKLGDNPASKNNLSSMLAISELPLKAYNSPMSHEKYTAVEDGKGNPSMKTKTASMLALSETPLGVQSSPLLYTKYNAMGDPIVKSTQLATFVSSTRLMGTVEDQRETMQYVFKPTTTTSSIPHAQPGDNIAIFVPNPPYLTVAMQCLFPWISPDAYVQVKQLPLDGPLYLRGGCTWSDILNYMVDLSAAPPPALLKLFSRSVPGSDSVELPSDYCIGMNVVDLLMCYSTYNRPVDRILQALPPMMPRVFYLSSSPSEGTVQLTVRSAFVSTSFTEENGRRGLCSEYLATRKKEDVIRMCLSPNPTFHWDPSVPSILIASGLGVAPFRSFWRKRAFSKKVSSWLKRNPPMVLYYECNGESEHLYKEEMGSYLTQVHVAYSTNEEKAKDVAGLLQEDSAQLVRLAKENAKIYVCGSAAMTSSVESVMRCILGELTMKDMLCSGKYVENVF